MNVFAVDTASHPASCAIMQDGIIMGSCVVRSMRRHSQHIMKMTESLFDALSLDVSETDVFAVTTGPGSFTGLRIGIATVRALAQAVGKPCVGISTLEAVAYNFAAGDEITVSMLDARRDEVFAAAYRNRRGGEPEEICAPCVMTIDEICARFAGAEPVIFAGDGMPAHRGELERVPNAIFAPAHLCETNAAAVAALAEIKAAAGNVVTYNDIIPVYLRKSQAERELEKKGRAK